jgi:hypothetical protein
MVRVLTSPSRCFGWQTQAMPCASTLIRVHSTPRRYTPGMAVSSLTRWRSALVQSIGCPVWLRRVSSSDPSSSMGWSVSGSG